MIKIYVQLKQVFQKFNYYFYITDIKFLTAI